MKRIIIQHLTVDNFITYQNGNLVKLFASPEKDRHDDAKIQPYTKDINSIDVDEVLSLI